VKHIAEGRWAWIPVLALLLLVPGCNDNDSAPRPTAPLSPNLGGPVILAPGQSKVVGAGGLEVGFTRMYQDSRCPEDVECFWQGDAAARLWAKAPGQDRSDFTLHTFPGFQTSQDYGDYQIGLTYVEPYPKHPDSIDPEDYRVTLYVTTR
jgi:hypothetical protein